MYDLSPANDALYTIGLGLHHSGVEIMGTEYSFASGGGVFESSPKEAPGARFREALEMGSFDGGQAEVRRAISDLSSDFGPEDYNLIRKNCNHFANALVWKLLGRTIPGHVNRLADFGVCCSCLLPKKLLEEAPVGDPNATSRTSSGGGGAYSSGSSSSQPQVAAFSGSGAKLGGTSIESGSGIGLRGRLFGGASSPRQDELSDRREKARMAALARLERASQVEGNATDTDKSR